MELVVQLPRAAELEPVATEATLPSVEVEIVDLEVGVVHVGEHDARDKGRHDGAKECSAFHKSDLPSDCAGGHRMAPRNRCLRIASQLARLLRRRHARYVAKARRASRFNNCGPKRLCKCCLGSRERFAAGLRVTCARWLGVWTELDERVIDVLDVLVLLELVDHRERFVGLRLRQLDRRRADVFVRRPRSA